MNKNKMIAIVLSAAAVVTGAITVVSAVQRDEVSPQVAVSDSGLPHEAELPPDDGVYAPFGLIMDEKTGLFTYQGQTVRYFIDEYQLDNSSKVTVREYLHEGGTVDLYTERNLAAVKPDSTGAYDPSGKLLGVRPFSQQAFDDRDLEAIKHPVSQGAESGDAPTPEEQAEMYAEYAPYGLVYDQQRGTLTFQGRAVRYFLDVRSSNGKPLAGGGFVGIMRSGIYNEKGVVDVYTVREFSVLDGEHEGVLMGVEAYSQEEFDQRTLDCLTANSGYGDAYAEVVQAVG